MDYKSLVRNVGTAFLAQGVAFFLSVIQTLLVPKLLGTTEYGYWQLFIFYQSYVGFAHLGLNDGVYLVHGGTDRSCIDKRAINSQFVFGILFESALALAIVGVAVGGGFGPDREFVITCTALFLVIQNAASFLSYLLQAMNETRRSSYSQIVERLAFLVPLLMLVFLRCQSFRPFVIAYMFSSACQLAYCMWLCRDFVRAGLAPVGLAARSSLSSILVGFKLMAANIASQLILGIARFAIDTVWGIDTFGQLSFALSLVSFFLAFVSQASMVLFPALRQTGLDESRAFFAKTRDLMSLLFPVVYALYYPFVWLVGLWLPAYASSFVFFSLLIPICVFDSKMNICCTTFFKVLRKEGLLLRVNLCTCAMSALLTLVGVFAARSIFFVIGGAVFAIVARSMWSERSIARSLSTQAAPTLSAGEVALTLFFIAGALLLPPLTGFLSYGAAYAAYLLAFRHKTKTLLLSVRHALRRGGRR